MLTSKEILEGWIQSSPMSGQKTLNRLLEDCLRYEVNLIPDSSNPHRKVIITKNFEFTVDTHSTGSSVSCWLVLPLKPPIQIIQATYWFSSSYTFNKSQFRKGAWDSALEEEILDLQSKVKAAKEVVEGVKKEKEDAEFEEAKRLVASYESYFKI